MIPFDDPERDELDDFVRAYEVAYARDGRAEIAEFLPPRDHPSYATVLCELIRVDLEFGWERGCPRSLSEYERAFPELRDDREGLRAISFEESRLRQQAEEGASPVESRRRAGTNFVDGTVRREEGAPGRHDRNGGGVGRPRHDEMGQAALAYRDFRRQHHEGDSAALDSWCASFSGRAEHARLFRDVHLSDPRIADRLARGLTTLPEVGDVFLGFELIGELGRGAFSRVYLARQGELADRPVALKVSPGPFREPQTLAQLQHTNIVPIYSMHRVDTLQAVCMPYFGSTTLKHIYEDISKQEAPPVSGRGLLSTLLGGEGGARRRVDSGWPGVETAGGPAAAPEEVPAGAAPPPSIRPSTDTLTMLEGLTYVQAVLWMAARVADGLAHAHERGILHRDLKPANILLTDEGQPMLLDFNLSEDLKVRSGTAAEIGGTLPYMSPEHLDAFRNGTRPVDARSDLYSLGILLFELLTGRRPFKVPDGPRDGLIDRLIEDRLGPPPGVRCWNKAVTPAVESIVRHCLEPDPRRRYQTARELREDLERQMAHRPLRYAPEPSLRERMAKCARRHPTLFGSTSIALLALSLISLLGAAAWFVTEEDRINAARFHHAAFRKKFEGCQLLLNTSAGPSEHLGPGIRLARRALDDYGVGGPVDWTAGPLVRRLPADDRKVLREEVSELVLLEARARVALAGR
ncbi:MAG: eukaryotic-like serine/threonine-protein kinase, partial [Chloroflexota bacterium]|nr:eukaryotic-like serine/threonine-protein kinase [Chloroflexota bacterium]